jgi:SHS2 domain-containing protein
MKRYEFGEHTADIIIRGFGDTIEEAFAATAEGMFAVMTDRTTIAPKETVALSVESIDREALLVTFLSKLIVKFEVDGYVFGDFVVTFTGPASLTAVGRGEKFVRETHGYGITVKGASYHMIRIEEGSPSSHRQCMVQVVVDI